MAADNGLVLSDLRLLMDNYQNIMKMNTVLGEQQKQLHELQKDMLAKQDELVKQQFQLLNQTTEVINRLDRCALSLSQVQTEIVNTTKTLTESVSNKIDKADDKIDSVHLTMTKQHSGISNKIYIALVGSVTVLGSIVALFASFLNDHAEIVNMLHRLLEFFNLA